MCSPRKRKEYNIKHQQLIQLTKTAVLAALTAIATMVIPIPIPGGGYANAGDIVILITAFLLGPLPAAPAMRKARPYTALRRTGYYL